MTRGEIMLFRKLRDGSENFRKLPGDVLKMIIRLLNLRARVQWLRRRQVNVQYNLLELGTGINVITLTEIEHLARQGLLGLGLPRFYGPGF